MGRIITGTKGFQFTVIGAIPPEIQDDEQAMMLWVSGNMSFTAIIAGFIRESHIEVVDLTTASGQPGPRLQK